MRRLALAGALGAVHMQAYGRCAYPLYAEGQLPTAFAHLLQNLRCIQTWPDRELLSQYPESSSQK